MKDLKEKSLPMIVVSAVILAAVNSGLWLAAQHGAIAPIGDHFLWAAFAVLNVVSLVWAISLLGLHPLIVALSYVAGGFLAFKGVQGLSGIQVAEITTAGATYGAFGALVIGNYTTKERMAYFSKRQVPFIFIIAALLVFDAVLSSEVSSAGGRVILNAVVFPFVLAGVIIGLVWSVLNRYGIGHKDGQSHTVMAVEQPDVVEEVVEREESNVLKIQMPVDAVEEEEVDAVAAIMEEVELPEEITPPVIEPVKPIVEKEEEFFPLEIDKDNDFVLQKEETYDVADMVAELDGMDEDPFTSMAFEESFQDSASDEDDPAGLIEEAPVVAASLKHEELEVVTEPPEKTVVEELKLPEPVPAKSAPSADWLSGHLDLLNKLK